MVQRSEKLKAIDAALVRFSDLADFAMREK